MLGLDVDRHRTRGGGRSAPGADAIALVEVDGGVQEPVLREIRRLPLVKQANALAF
jgi:D-3-phosphoglycerate dehydrogenase